ncbi:MAG: DUF481 domain-containing protein, partial [Pirellulaceae bacterium]|nr:DUF481 domain-containing protein [Pirellulaceae bacterium]
MPPQSPEQWLDQENSGSIVGNGPGEDANGFLLPEEEIFDDGFWDSTYFPFEDWENSFEFGLNGTNGNSDTLNIRMGIDTLYEDEAYKRSLKFKYSNKSNNNQTIAHHINLEGRLEKKLSDRWTYFVHGTTEYDEFKAFDTRVAVDTGFGWDFLKNDINTLTFRAGLGASYEIGGPNDEVKPELVTGISWERKIYDNQKLSFGVEVFPNLEDFADHRVNTTAAWEIDVAPEWGTKLKLSIDDRYDSTPGTAKHNDLDYGFLLLWDF